MSANFCIATADFWEFEKLYKAFVEILNSQY